MDNQSFQPPLTIITDAHGTDHNDCIGNHIDSRPDGVRNVVNEEIYDTRHCPYSPSVDSAPAQQWAYPQSFQNQIVPNNSLHISYGPYDPAWLCAPAAGALDIPRSGRPSSYISRPRSRTAPSRFQSHQRPHPYNRPSGDVNVEHRHHVQGMRNTEYSSLPPPQESFDGSATLSELDYTLSGFMGSAESNNPGNPSHAISEPIEYSTPSGPPTTLLSASRSSSLDNAQFAGVATRDMTFPYPQAVVDMHVDRLSQRFTASMQIDGQGVSRSARMENARPSPTTVNPELLDPVLQSDKDIPALHGSGFDSFVPTDVSGLSSYYPMGRSPWPPDSVTPTGMAPSPDTPSVTTPADSPQLTNVGSSNGAPPYGLFQQFDAPQVFSTNDYSVNFNPQVAKPAVLDASMKRRRGRSDAKLFFCGYCSQSFTAKHNLKYHRNSHFGVKEQKCTGCDAFFNTLSDRKRHEKACSAASAALKEGCKDAVPIDTDTAAM